MAVVMRAFERDKKLALVERARVRADPIEARTGAL